MATGGLTTLGGRRTLGGLRTLAGLAVLSGAVLGLQVALTRVFSITQYYHFAFLVISLALLGFGASGSFLAIWPRVTDRRAWPWFGMLFAAAAFAGYLVANQVAFDSYRVALEPEQGLVLALDLVALALPFLFAGALVGAMLRAETARSGRVYGANLLGAAAGAVVAPLAIGAVGSAHTVVLCAAAGALSALLVADRRGPLMVATVGLAGAAILLVASPAFLELVPSPYKRIAVLALDPATRVIRTIESPTSRLDIVESPTIHSAPGLSLTYGRALPAETGLVIDGDALLPVIDARHVPDELADALPISVALAVRPGGRVLLLGSGGGMDAWAALTRGAHQVTIVEPNPLVLGALEGPLRERAGLAGDPRVQLVEAEIRTFAASVDDAYDIVELTLADNYRPISAGAFSLTETYALTVEAVRDYLHLVGKDGLLVITRWVQEPPSESARTLAIAIEALGDRPARQHVVAFRSFQTVTLLVKATPFTAAETGRLLAEIDARRYDLVLAPTIPPGSVNRYAVLPAPTDHELALALAGTADRGAVYAGSTLDIAPTTDDHPYFFQFFRTEHTPAVLDSLGRRWQPFGGSGYLVLVALLGFALLATGLFIVLPIAVRRPFRVALVAAGTGRALRTLGYVVAIGLGYLFVEVALVGRLIALIGTPTIAFASVVGGLLLWSGVGSLASARLPWRPSILLLAGLLAIAPVVIAALVPLLLGLPLLLRVGSVLLILAPVGFLMGIPLPRLVTSLGRAPGLVPWAWAANGGASVVGAIAGAMLALSAGFGTVLLAAALLYLAAAGLAIGEPAAIGEPSTIGEPATVTRLPS
jgi:hypothetical protein